MKAISFFLLFLLSNYSYALITASQSAELYWQGTVSDQKQNCYNIRVIPGYRYVLLSSAYGWVGGWANQKIATVDLGSSLLETGLSVKHLFLYFQPEPYLGIADGATQSYNSTGYLLTEYMGNQLADEWDESLTKAGKSWQRGSVGRFLAYPLAIVENSLKSTLRITTGMIALGGTAVYGLALRPAYELASPCLKSSGSALLSTAESGYNLGRVGYNLAINQLGYGSAYPALMFGWNSVGSSLFSIFGSAPTLKSADGWWVEMTPGSPEYYQKLAMEDSLAGWGIEPGSLQSGCESVLEEYQREQEKKNQLQPLYAELDSLKNVKANIDNQFTVLAGQIPAQETAAEPELPRNRLKDLPVPTVQTDYLLTKINRLFMQNPRFAGLNPAVQERIVRLALEKHGSYFMVDFQLERGSK